MIVSRMKYITVGLVLFTSILAEPGDRIPNHPNCPTDQGPMPVYFVHPTNCSRFFECRQKDAWELECSAGLHFNSKIDVCDYPINAQCEPQSMPTTTNSPTTPVSSTVTTSTTTVAKTVETTPTNSPTTLEPSMESSTTTTPYPTPEDTTPFYTTTEGTTTTPYPTPEDTTPFYTTTEGTTTTPYPTPEDTTPFYTTTEGTTTTPYPTPEDTTPFYTTTEGTTTTPYPTPEDTTPFYTTPEGTTTTSQRPPSSDVTPLPECPPFGATQPNYWGDSSDCSRYLGCIENCVQEFKCPSGLFWNDQQKQCDIFGSSHCCPVIPPAPNVWPSTTVMY